MLFELKFYNPGGPHPNFSEYHIWKCYHSIYTKGPIGRRALTELLGIGEGSTRTLLKWMEKEGCIVSDKRGTRLTIRGKQLFDMADISIVPVKYVKYNDLEIGKFNCAVLVRGHSNKVHLGCEQRDAAVRAGASNAMTLVAVDGKVVFPCDHNFPDQELMRPMMSRYQITDGDVIIIAGANSYDHAEKGAVTAALALISNSKEESFEESILLSRDYEEEDVKTIALAVHELVGRLPVTMRTRRHYGVRCENGKIIESNYTGPVLEETLRTGEIVRKPSKSGKYWGVPVLAVPLVRNNEAIAVIGVFDTTRGSYYEWLGKDKCN